VGKLRRIGSGAVVILLVSGCGTGAANARRWRAHRECGTPQSGGLTTDEQWVTNGPWYVAMGYETARGIARQVGPYELQPPYSHPAPGDVPCDIASSVALAAADARTHWHSDRGPVTAGWTGYSVGPAYRFDCNGTHRRDRGATETCTHESDRHAGEITVRFTIRALDPPFLVPWRSIGHISLGESKAQVESHYGQPGNGYHVIQRYGDNVQGYYVLRHARVTVTFYGKRVGELGFSTPYYRTRSGFGVGSTMPKARTWHGFVYNAWNRGKPCECWVKVGLGARSLPATTANFLKPWFFIYTKHRHVTSFYFALRFVD
jgi:hypothetical protein